MASGPSGYGTVRIVGIGPVLKLGIFSATLSAVEALRQVLETRKEESDGKRP
jgi:hypothetical protein